MICAILSSIFLNEKLSFFGWIGCIQCIVCLQLRRSGCHPLTTSHIHSRLTGSLNDRLDRVNSHRLERSGRTVRHDDRSLQETLSRTRLSLLWQRRYRHRTSDHLLGRTALWQEFDAMVYSCLLAYRWT